MEANPGPRGTEGWSRWPSRQGQRQRLRGGFRIRAWRTAGRGECRRATGRRRPATPAGRRPPTGPTRSGCSRSRIAPGSPTWSRCGTGGCWSRRSPSTGARPRSWPPTWPAPLSPAWTSSCRGDAHLSNFGLFASPERELLFGLNDFDETLPGPFEYRREAAGGQLHDRGPEQRLRQGRHPGGDAGVGGGLPGGDGRLRPDGALGGLVCASDRGGAPEGDAPRRQGRQDQKANQGGQAGREERQEGGRQGPHP